LISVRIWQSAGEFTMGSGLWFITILKEQPWIGLVAGTMLFLLLFWVKRLVVKKLMADQETD
jgi:ABC-type uncharacterized transport system permease subunit